MPKRSRKYFHFKDLEENNHGFWRMTNGEERRMLMTDAEELMRDVGSFEECMQRAVDEWPNSVLHNLTVPGSNKLAWLGHAGCCLAVGSPEETTRCAWHKLNEEEQNAANAAAQRVLDRWINA